MKKQLFATFFTIAILFTACIQTIPKVDVEKEIGEIRLVLEKYALANENQDMNMIEEIWSSSDQIVSIGTTSSDKLIGFSKIKEVVQKQFDAFKNTYISYRDQIIQLSEDGKTAWFSEILNYNFILDGKAQTYEGLRYTGVLTKKEGKWKLVQTHLSVPEKP